MLVHHTQGPGVHGTGEEEGKEGEREGRRQRDQSGGEGEGDFSEHRSFL